MAKFATCPTKLDQKAIDTYWEKGFIAFEGALSPDEVSQAKQALSEIVVRSVTNPHSYSVKKQDRSKPSQSGAIYKSKSGRAFFQLEPDIDPTDKTPAELEEHVRKYMWFEDEAPILQRIYANHPRTRGVVESILGSGTELYQSMALVKPAHIGIDKPWHQDNAYFSIENLDEVVGTWIALDDSTVENGCMHFIPGGHKKGPLRHHHTYDCEIVEGRIDTTEAVPVELKAGGIILFHGNIPHYTPPNTSDRRRRAIQYHYRKSTNTIIDAKRYCEVFKEADGTPASCVAVKRGF